MIFTYLIIIIIAKVSLQGVIQIIVYKILYGIFSKYFLIEILGQNSHLNFKLVQNGIGFLFQCAFEVLFAWVLPI
jgi:hypothetical protein